MTARAIAILAVRDIADAIGDVNAKHSLNMNGPMVIWPLEITVFHKGKDATFDFSELFRASCALTRAAS